MPSDIATVAVDLILSLLSIGGQRAKADADPPPSWLRFPNTFLPANTCCQNYPLKRSTAARGARFGMF